MWASTAESGGRPGGELGRGSLAASAGLVGRRNYCWMQGRPRGALQTPARARSLQMPRASGPLGFRRPGPHLLAALVEARRRLATRPRLLLLLTHGSFLLLAGAYEGCRGGCRGRGERGRGGLHRPS